MRSGSADPRVTSRTSRFQGCAPGESLEEALSKVPGRMREVLILHDVEGHTHEQIGELLGITIGTSKSQLFKARARMRELLSPNGFGEYMIEQREGVEA